MQKKKKKTAKEKKSTTPLLIDWLIMISNLGASKQSTRTSSYLVKNQLTAGLLNGLAARRRILLTTPSAAKFWSEDH